jgi:hypothetical protein
MQTPAVMTVRTSISAARANSHVTNAISATNGAFTPSRKAPANRERCSHARRECGKKMPMVATAAPGIPFKMQPIKVAVVNNGPGVI